MLVCLHMPSQSHKKGKSKLKWKYSFIKIKLMQDFSAQFTFGSELFRKIHLFTLPRHIRHIGSARGLPCLSLWKSLHWRLCGLLNERQLVMLAIKVALIHCLCVAKSLADLLLSVTLWHHIKLQAKHVAHAKVSGKYLNPRCSCDWLAPYHGNHISQWHR